MMRTGKHSGVSQQSPPGVGCLTRSALASTTLWNSSLGLQVNKWFEARRKKERGSKPTPAAAAGSVPISATGPSTGAAAPGAVEATPDSATAMEVDPQEAPPQGSQARDERDALQTVEQVAVEGGPSAAGRGETQAEVRSEPPQQGAAPPAAPHGQSPAAGTPQPAPATSTGVPPSAARDVIDISPDVIDISHDDATPAAAGAAAAGPSAGAASSPGAQPA